MSTQDHTIVIPDTDWSGYRKIIKAVGGRITEAICQPPDFKLDLKALKASITPETIALVFSSPQSITGATFTQNELADICHLLDEFPKLHIICDEVFADLNLDSTFHSILSVCPPEYRQRLLVVNSLSKSFGLDDIRVGWGIGGTDLIKQMQFLKQSTMDPLSDVNLRIALMAHSQAGQKAQTKELEKLRANRDLVASHLKKELDFTLPETQVGPYILIPLEKIIGRKSPSGTIINDNLSFALEFLREHQAVIIARDQPSQRGQIAISLAIQQKDLQIGINRLTQFMASLKA